MNLVHTDGYENIYSDDIDKIIASFAPSFHYQRLIAIDNYPSNIVKYFQSSIKGSLFEHCKKAKIPYSFGFERFGLIINFDKKTELKLHNEEMQLIPEIKTLVEQFGVVILKNAYLTASIANMFHRNNFAHLNFHVDRNDIHDNRYSLYTRSPFDEEQQYPRKASTLFIDNAVGFLQARLEGLVKEGIIGRQLKYEIFRDTEINQLFGSVVLEQPWGEPFGIGEIAVINNNTVLHSSYKHGLDKGYRIGARYLF
ncbi:MAG: hypothetical protein MJK12_11120 [Colwellia sp.]|nr:hypothetical protein [Colwellia sp.]